MLFKFLTCPSETIILYHEAFSNVHHILIKYKLLDTEKKAVIMTALVVDVAFFVLIFA